MNTNYKLQISQVEMATNLLKHVFEQMKNHPNFRDEYPVESRKEILSRIEGVAEYIAEIARIEGELK